MFLVAIAGGSGSGKTTFAKKILARCPDSQVGIVHLDSYYRSPMPAGFKNFDHPDAFDWNLILQHLQLFREGKRVSTPIYDYRESQRTGRFEEMGPCKAVIMEGILTLWREDVRSLFDVKIFLNVDADIRFIRRLHRDVQERGRTVDSVIQQYYGTVRPMHHEFLENTRQYADLIVGEETDRAADLVAARVRQVL